MQKMWPAVFLIAGGCLVFLNCTIRQEHRQAHLFRSAAKKTHAAVTPVPISFEAVQEWYWIRQDAVNARLKECNADILFVGNSIMHEWENTGKEYWDHHFAPLNAVNLGFGWDWTQHTLWRLDHTDFDAVSPKLSVVLIGTNNSNENDNTAEEIADGIIAVCGRLHSRFPKMKILLLAIFPRQAEPCTQRTKVAEASALASRIADGRQIRYLDLSALFLNGDDSLKQELMPDCLHPNKKGYRVWAEAVVPVIHEMLE
ncbi:GDSL family lipase [bacterium]|nr:GDSL family lipase [bacterium]